MTSNEKTIKQIEEFLFKKYGEVKPQWATLLKQLNDNLLLIDEMRKALKDSGLFDVRTGKKNPLLNSIKDLQSQNIVILKELTCTPWTEGRTKQTNTGDDAELLKSIMG